MSSSSYTAPAAISTLILVVANDGGASLQKDSFSRVRIRVLDDDSQFVIAGAAGGFQHGALNRFTEPHLQLKIPYRRKYEKKDYERIIPISRPLEVIRP